MPKQFLRSPWPKLSVGTHIVRVEGTDPEIGSELKVFNLDKEHYDYNDGDSTCDRLVEVLLIPLVGGVGQCFSSQKSKQPCRIRAGTSSSFA